MRDKIKRKKLVQFVGYPIDISDLNHGFDYGIDTVNIITFKRYRKETLALKKEIVKEYGIKEKQFTVKFISDDVHHLSDSIEYVNDKIDRVACKKAVATSINLSNKDWLITLVLYFATYNLSPSSPIKFFHIEDNRIKILPIFPRSGAVFVKDFSEAKPVKYPPSKNLDGNVAQLLEQIKANKLQCINLDTEDPKETLATILAAYFSGVKLRVLDYTLDVGRVSTDFIKGSEKVWESLKKGNIQNPYEIFPSLGIKDHIGLFIKKSYDRGLLLVDSKADIISLTPLARLILNNYPNQ